MGPMAPTDCAFIAYGSLAREEWTAGSDLDWTLLVDGRAMDSHRTAAHDIRRAVEDLGLSEPGRTGVFGGLTFSHDLIHMIGGDSDTNKNTTRRILLLLESVCRGAGEPVRERVVNRLLGRYIEDDHGYRSDGRPEPYVPGFLLNDFVRYWRTMAVDFAAKRRDRDGEGWALRRLKLRMSRKLIFAAGLAACLRCQLKPSAAMTARFDSSEDLCAALVMDLDERTQPPPLDILAQVFVDYEAWDAGSLAFGAYDEFLGVLASEGDRAALQRLHPDGAYKDDLFQRSDDIARRFQEGLSMLFFDTDADLTQATQRFGVF